MKRSTTLRSFRCTAASWRGFGHHHVI